MRRINLLLLLLLPSCSLIAPSGPDRETVSQLSVVENLLDGDYDGRITCRELLRRGDFGIGTFHALDGEMVVLDGKVYKAGADGKVHLVPASVTTPFAAVTFFDPDFQTALRFPAEADEPDMGWSRALERLIDDQARAPNAFLAVRVDGLFTYVKTRSVPAQKKPYPPLAEVTKKQPEFEFRDVRGMLVGFRYPPFARALNMGDYHFHFLTADRTAGGHVLQFVPREGTASVDITPDFHLFAAQRQTQRADRADTTPTRTPKRSGNSP